MNTVPAIEPNKVHRAMGLERFDVAIPAPATLQEIKNAYAMFIGRMPATVVGISQERDSVLSGSANGYAEFRAENMRIVLHCEREVK